MRGDDKNFPERPIRVIENMTDVAELIEPDIAAALGRIATEGLTDESRNWLAKIEVASGKAALLLEGVRVRAEALQSLAGTQEAATPAEPAGDSPIVSVAIAAAEQSASPETLAALSADTVADQLPTEDERPATAEAEEAIVLNELELEILQYALQGSAFRMETLRKEVSALRDLSDSQYKDFKLQFRRLLDFYKHYLSTQGIEGRWIEAGKARGLHYQLEIKSVADPMVLLSLQGKPAEPPAPAVTALTIKDRPRLSPPRPRREIDPAVFAERLNEGIRKFIANEGSKGEVKANLLRKHMAENLGIPEAQAEGLLSQFLEADLLFKVRHDGNVYFTQDRPIKSSTRAKKKEAEPDSTERLLTKENLGVIADVFDSLAALRSIDQYAPVKKLWQGSKLRDIVDEATYRRSVRLLNNVAAQQYIILEQGRQAGGRSSKAQKVQVVRFANQEIKTRWKLERLAVIEEIKSLCRTEQPDKD